MRLNFVIALAAEARPLIDHYNLRRDDAASPPFEVYRNETTQLIICGMGKVNAAAATGWLAASAHASSDQANQLTRNQVWINVGICGHGHEPVGSLLCAAKITDSGTGKNWYPPQVVRHSIPLTSLHSIDHVEHSYTSPIAYEMEASGFYPVASRVSTGELCQCLKVVSDNPDSSTSKLTPAHVTRLIDEHLATIARVTEQWVTLSDDLESNAKYSGVSKDAIAKPWLGQWHFSVTQTHELTRLLRHLALRDQVDVMFEACSSLPRSSDVLACLRESLVRVPTLPTQSSCISGEGADV